MRAKVSLLVTLLLSGGAWATETSVPAASRPDAPQTASPEAGSAADDVVMRAMVDEMARGMKDLQLGDLPRPYFMQLTGEERTTWSIRAAYGGLLNSDDRRMRMIKSRVRVGSYALDNTNFGRGFGNAGLLPLDDDYEALRHAIWLAIDDDYKRALETLAAKLAYMKDKSVEDRPADYAPAEPVVAAEPRAALPFDVTVWEAKLTQLSARFREYPLVQDSQARLLAATADQWIVNSEGTRVRIGDTGVLVEIEAEVQADDGMKLSDSVSYLGESFDRLPPIEKMLEDIDTMCKKLLVAREAEIPEHYTGPVLFEASAAGRAVETVLADRLCARPIPLGSGGWADQSLEKRIGLRILPRSFQVYDDPRTEEYDGEVTAGSYHFDDEAQRPHKVTLVENGVLKTLVAGRAPTDKIKQTTGHARSGGFGDPQAHVGCLYFQDDNGVGPEQLKKELLVAAQEEGLDYALRIESLGRGGGGNLGDPVCAYKVYVEDGREEPIRGMEFKPVQIRAFKRILAAGNKPELYNTATGVASSFIVPALLFEELDLSKTEEEFDKPPILIPPGVRGAEQK